MLFRYLGSIGNRKHIAFHRHQTPHLLGNGLTYTFIWHLIKIVPGPALILTRTAFVSLYTVKRLVTLVSLSALSKMCLLELYSLMRQLNPVEIEAFCGSTPSRR